ncbi:MAG: transglutaminase family protein [Thermomicrobiales bacterium]
MQRSVIFVLAYCLLPTASCLGKEESFDIALLDGARVGTLTTTVTSEKDNKLLRVKAVLDLTLRRFGSPVRLRMEQGSIESPDGTILAVFMKQLPGGGRSLVLDGTVIDDDKLLVKVTGIREFERRVPWKRDVLGLVQQERLFATKKPKPGDKFSFLRYEPTYNSVLTVRVVVKPREAVDVLGKKQTLLRVELTPDELKGSNITVKPHKAVWWLDDSFAVVRKQTEMDGLGTLILVRTAKGKAVAVTSAVSADIGKRSLVPLDRVIARPYDTRSLTYRITVRGEDKPAVLFVQDGHQSIRNVKGDTFELRVNPIRAGTPGKEKPTLEYLASNHYIDHTDPRVKELARRAVGSEKDPWKRALRIERFVKNHLRNDNTTDLAPASRIAKDLRGDCRHHALLTAAMCRAAGLPSRTAIGLLYVHRGSPYLGFHMWAEVLINGQWLGIDSTLGKGGVSATHVKITQHSWHEAQSLTPLLPVSRVTGKLRISVVAD